MDTVEMWENLLMWSREAVLRRKWLGTWERLCEHVLRMPEWMQETLLEDMDVAFQNRIVTFERVKNACESATANKHEKRK